MTQYNPFPYYELDDDSRLVNDGYAQPRYEMEEEPPSSELACHCPSCFTSLSVDASTTATAKVQCMVCGTVFFPLGNTAASRGAAPPPPPYYETPGSYPPPRPSYTEPLYHTPNPYGEPSSRPANAPGGYPAEPYFPSNPPASQPPVNPAYGNRKPYYRNPSPGYQPPFQEPDYLPPSSAPPSYTVSNYDSGYRPPPPPAYGYDPYGKQPLQGFERHNPLTMPPAPPMQPMPQPQPQPQPQSIPMAGAPSVTYPPTHIPAPQVPTPAPINPPAPAPPPTIHTPPGIQQLSVRTPIPAPTPEPEPEPKPKATAQPVPITKAAKEEQTPEHKPKEPPPPPEEQAELAKKEALTGTDAPLGNLSEEIENGNAAQPFKLIKSEYDYYMQEEEPPVRKKSSFLKIVFLMFLPLVGIGWSLWQLFWEGSAHYFLYGGLSLCCFIIFLMALSAYNRGCPQCGRWSALGKESRSDQYGGYTIRQCKHCDFSLESEK